MAVADGDGEESQPVSWTNLTASAGSGVMAAGGVGPALFTFANCAPTKWPSSDSRTVIRGGRIRQLAGDRSVLPKVFGARVNHHAGEPSVNALFAQLERVAVVDDGPRSEMLERLTAASISFLEVNRVGVGTRAFGDLEYQRGFSSSRPRRCLDEFHVVDVECAEGVFTF